MYYVLEYCACACILTRVSPSRGGRFPLQKEREKEGKERDREVVGEGERIFFLSCSASDQ